MAARGICEAWSLKTGLAESRLGLSQAGDTRLLPVAFLERFSNGEAIRTIPRGQVWLSL